MPANTAIKALPQSAWRFVYRRPSCMLWQGQSAAAFEFKLCAAADKLCRAQCFLTPP